MEKNYKPLKVEGFWPDLDDGDLLDERNFLEFSSRFVSISLIN